MKPTLVIRARVKVLGLLPGQEKVVTPSPSVQSLLRRGMIEVVQFDAPDAEAAHVGGDGPAEVDTGGTTTDEAAASQEATRPPSVDDAAAPGPGDGPVEGDDAEPVEAEDPQKTKRKRG